MHEAEPGTQGTGAETETLAPGAPRLAHRASPGQSGALEECRERGRGSFQLADWERFLEVEKEGSVYA